MQPLLTRLLDVWKGSNPDYGSCISRAISMPSSRRCLTQSVLKIVEWFGSPCEPESFSDKSHAEPDAQKAHVQASTIAARTGFSRPYSSFASCASWAPEGDYSHQAVAIYLAPNLVACQSQRHSLVALSSAEAETHFQCMGNRLALSLHGQLSEMILSKPPYIAYCDSSAVVQLTQQLSASKTRTRHLSMRASWLRHLVQHESASMQFVPTAHQKADNLNERLDCICT